MKIKKISKRLLAVALALMLSNNLQMIENVNAENVNEDIMLAAETYDATQSYGTVLEENVDGKGSKAAVTEEDGRIVWNFTVHKQQTYYVKIQYYNVSGSSLQMERRISIDGEKIGDSNIVFKRSYSPVGEQQYDLQGNEIRREEKENHCWQEVYVTDVNSFAQEECSVELAQGQHTIVIDSLLDKMAIGCVILTPNRPLTEEYQTILEQQTKNGATSGKTKLRKFQAEQYLAKSDASILVQSDRYSVQTEPSSSDVIVYNTIGGSSWSKAGQWVEWKIDVPAEGWYQIGMRWKQSEKSGGVSSRILTIDGDIPFQEVKNLTFTYDSSWQSNYLGEEEPYLFYLTKGEHIIRLTANLGTMSEVLSATEDLINTLNDIYMKIIMVSGTSPDMKRDYNFKMQIPEVIEQYKTISDEIDALIKDIRQITGKNQSTTDFENMSSLLKTLYEDPESTAKRLSDFSSSITSLASWLSTNRQQPLQIDYLYLAQPEAKVPVTKGGFLKSLLFQIKQLLSSYWMDYTSVGRVNETAEDEEPLQVWIIAGTEQAQVVQKLINEQFTPNNSVSVQLQNVTQAALMPAIFAGRGPDVVLNLDEATPVNYALRGVAMDLAQFGDVDEVLKQYHPCTYEAFQLNDSLYALPTTVDYPVLFYRKDVINELEIDLKDCQTWDTMLQVVLPKLQTKNLKFGLSPSMNSYLMFYYQGDNELYNDERTNILLDTKEGVNAFTTYSSIYTDYKQDLSFNFVNLFRSGEMPMAVVSYSQYCQLATFAPEIDGEWGMMLVPGTINSSGEINHTVACTVTGASIMADAENPEDAWEFLKWWAGDKTQSDYATEIETLLGLAGRVNPASNVARDRIPWTKDVKAILNAQLNASRGVPQVPGSYYAGRYFEFAFRDVVYDGDDIVQTLISVTEEINAEIHEKTNELLKEDTDAKK